MIPNATFNYQSQFKALAGLGLEEESKKPL
jgi:hypothetical protein